MTILKKATILSGVLCVLNLISFAPVHAAGYDPVTVEIPVVVENATVTVTIMPKNEEDAVLLDKTELKDITEGSFSVTGVTPGDHLFYITQTVDNPLNDVTYDETEYIAEVYFEDNDGTLNGSAIIYTEDSNVKYESAKFANVVKTKEESNTGILGKNIETYAALTGFGAFLIGIALMLIVAKKDGDICE